MTFTAWLNRFQMSKLAIKTPVAEMEWTPRASDREAAWELYVELLTRITTQPLPAGSGDEKVALDSVYALFAITRGVLKSKGPGCVRFTRLAVIVLNQIVRPFTAKWHRLSLQGAFADAAQCQVFRAELEELQKDLRNYTHMLADMADVEELKDLVGD